jgi:neogenin
MAKSQRKLDSRPSNDQSFQQSKDLSKLALDSLLSRNKNSQFSPSKFQDSNDYLERLNDNQQSDSINDEEYDDDDDEEEDDEEGSIHSINPNIDPIQLLHALTHSNHETFSHDISHFSNSQTQLVTRKPQLTEDNKHASVPLPGAPRALQAQIIKPRFVTLNWLEPAKHPDEVVSYTVYYKMNLPDARFV